jgi:hypothetical protein
MGGGRMTTWQAFVLISCFLIAMAVVLTIAYLWLKFLLHGAYMLFFQDYTFKQALHEICNRIALTILLPIVIITLGLRYKPNARITSTLPQKEVAPPKPRPKKKVIWELQYGDLQTTHVIRLLAIHPGQYGDDLYGSIDYANVNYMPEYTALSYTWADESGDTKLSHRLDTPAGFIQITKNCDAAIRRLRHPDEVKKVWIDAICIDQRNALERGRQVAMMSDIYCKATSVVVYIGEEDSETAIFFDWMNAVPARYLKIPAPWHGDVSSRFPPIRWLALWLRETWAFLRSLSLTDVQPKERALTIPDEKLLDIIVRYSSRRWFTRIWVLQEVALPPLHNTTIICGTKTTTSIRALHALSFLPPSSSQNSNNLLSIFTLLRKRHSKPYTSHILDIMLATRGRSCTDPRDRIFGLLSIADGMDHGMKLPTPLEVDYSLSTAELYITFSKYCITHYGPAFLLSLIKSPPSAALVAEGLPSWCTDWTVEWPNVKAIGGRDFPAGSRNEKEWDEGALFGAPEGYEVLTLVRPRILSGYFTKEGQMDGVVDWESEAVESLEEGEVLVEMNRGVAMLLRRTIHDCEFVFVRVCPHALSKEGVNDLVQRWSDVVCNGFVLGIDEKEEEYKTAPELFRIC